MSRTVWKSRIVELQRIKSALEGRTITIQEIADATGVSRATIYSWIAKDVFTIDAEKTAKLSAFFGVPAWRLWELGEENNETCKV